MSLFPLPFTCEHQGYIPGVEDAHGNESPGWAAGVATACAWWSPSSAEPLSPPTGGDRVNADLVLIVDAAVTVGHRDRFTVDGRDFEVIGLPKDYNHGPFGFDPGRLVVEFEVEGLVKVTFNEAGFRELRTSAAAKALLHEQADPMCERANSVPSTTEPAASEPYYEVEDGSDRNRARLRVRTTSVRAARHEAKTQALQRSI